MRWTRTLPVVLLVVALGGCAARSPAAVLREGPRMIDLYRGAAVASEREQESAVEPAATWRETRCRWWRFAWPCEMAEPMPADVAADAPSYAREAANELEVVFPRLPNPDIYIYVPPHLATESRLPVPGYTTVVPLYDRVEYALPGEVRDAGEEAP